jgi:hypothetical protein
MAEEMWHIVNYWVLLHFNGNNIMPMPGLAAGTFSLLHVAWVGYLHGINKYSPD